MDVESCQDTSSPLHIDLSIVLSECSHDTDHFLQSQTQLSDKQSAAQHIKI